MDGELTTKPSPLMFAAGLVVGLVAGVAGGYMWAQRKLGLEFEARLEKETEQYRVVYQNLPGNKYATPQEAVEDLIAKDPDAASAMENYQGGDKPTAYHKIASNVEDKDYEPLVDIPEPPPVPQNIFKQERDRNKPYLISQEEFMTGEYDYTQTSLTYYELDEILADERDDQIDDVLNVVGPEFKANFGYESSDEGVVHVRNDKLGIDFEITRNESSFGQVVLGQDEPMRQPGPSARQRRAEG